jgi:hypothetical protein
MLRVQSSVTVVPTSVTTIGHRLRIDDRKYKIDDHDRSFGQSSARIPSSLSSTGHMDLINTDYGAIDWVRMARPNCGLRLLDPYRRE